MYQNEKCESNLPKYVLLEEWMNYFKTKETKENQDQVVNESEQIKVQTKELNS